IAMRNFMVSPASNRSPSASPSGCLASIHQASLITEKVQHLTDCTSAALFKPARHQDFATLAMPELPEVETVVRGLRPALKNQTIKNVELKRKDLRFPFQPGFAAGLKGKKIEAVERRAKYLLFRLS